jgi:signal recognition particle receptor subunit beta
MTSVDTIRPLYSIHPVQHTTLDLSYNKITTLSVLIAVPNLIRLQLFEVTVADLPENQTGGFDSDIEAIRSYYRQKLLKTDTLYEAKVLFVGEPEAGKTSLMKRLSVRGYKVDPAIKEHSTLGITIHWDWSFDFPNPQNKQFKAHLWDFGGQQIQYYIHQFFLTENALYILVLDDRKEAPNIDYWFRIIHLLGRESPVLVVRNRKNIDAATGFDWIKYKNRYKGDIETLDYEDIDLVNQDDRFHCIEDRIKELLLKLRHVGKELPASWLGIRKEVIDLKGKNHITGSDETFIAPLLLSDVAPDTANKWERKGTLCFRYRYKFMPVGIITRIIVRLNDLIVVRAGEDQVWKSGVILGKDGCTALVKTDISHEGLNIIDISIQGDRLSAKDILALIRGTIDAIHKQSFKDMDVELLVPCICDVCQEAEKPYLFELSRLKDHINANLFEIRCEKKGSFKLVSIEQLLGGIVVRNRYDREIGPDFGNASGTPSEAVDTLAQCLIEVSRANARQITPPPQPAEKEWKKWLPHISLIVGILLGLAGLYKFVLEDILKQPKPVTKFQLVPPPAHQNNPTPVKTPDTGAETTNPAAIDAVPDSVTGKSAKPASR